MSDGKTFVQHPVVAEYYRSGFLLELVERHGLKKKEEPANNAATFAAYYGVKAFPAELEKFLRMRDEYEFVHHRLAEWRIFGEDVWLPDPAKGNLAEQIIKLDQRNYLGTCMLEYAAGCIFLGTAGNGDAYLAYADPDENDSGPKSSSGITKPTIWNSRSPTRCRRWPTPTTCLPKCRTPKKMTKKRRHAFRNIAEAFGRIKGSGQAELALQSIWKKSPKPMAFTRVRSTPAISSTGRCGSTICCATTASIR